MKFKKTAALLLAGTMLATTALTGCTGGGDGGDSGSNPGGGTTARRPWTSFCSSTTTSLRSTRT